MARLASYASHEERLALGLMSGMSADGLDLALVRIAGATPPLDVDLVAYETRTYEAALGARIHAAVRGTTREVCELSFELAETWARVVLSFLATHGVAPDEVDVLASHGQTLDHVPPGRGAVASTLQVGDGDVLAERTGILTVSDFRPRDVAAGGEGAPLVPFADWLLYARPGDVSACQNLGSIANVTVVPERREDVLAFDAGPANVLIDAFARHATGDDRTIDRDGELSARGRVNAALLDGLLDGRRDFLERPPPKSAGYDDFGPAWGAGIAARHHDVSREDLVRTAVAFTARALGDAYERFVCPTWPTLRRVRLSGGGAHNPTLVEEIRRELGRLGLELERLAPAWIDAKEAVCFALLADATLRGVPGNVPGATGAARAVLLGKISP